MAIFVTLVVAGILCLLLETVVPGGVLGVIGVLCLIGAVVTAYLVFETDTAHGIVVAFTILGLAGVLAWMRWFPQSRLGQRFAARGTVGTINLDYRAYEGAVGVTLSRLRPAGMVEINGERVDVVADGTLIERGVEVRVIEAAGNRLVVRPVEEA